MFKPAIAALCLALALACPATAMEWKTVPLANGTVSVEMPDNWVMDAPGEYLETVIHDGKNQGSVIVIAAPNPLLNANQLVAMELTSLTKALGSHEIVDAIMDRLNGNERMLVHFFAPADKPQIVGLINLVYFGDSVVMAMATAADENFDNFVGNAQKVMESCMVNMDALKNDTPKLRAIAEKYRDDTIKEWLTPDKTWEDIREEVLQILPEETLRKAG